MGFLIVITKTKTIRQNHQLWRITWHLIQTMREQELSVRLSEEIKLPLKNSG
ncbi:hypothetical protein MTR_4g019950 [Medicago truncatula]|uniref:Transmembrane protein n=1 Tax=Medicago truncatula TaxID=3880 RepID=A0A072UHT3_MEDTR|nr:hypothetical protein MTR_4g019950 [Medicago truncatula]